jgi:hypothetical protein
MTLNATCILFFNYYLGGSRTFSIKTPSIMTFSITTPSIMTFSITTLSIMTFRIKTLSIMTLSMTANKTQHSA